MDFLKNIIILILFLVSNRRSCDGRFHFRMDWPQLHRYNEWWQDTNPTNETVVVGYKGKNQLARNPIYAL